MKKKIVVGLIALVVMAMFTGCIESTTTIKEINDNPDYAGKTVTVEGILTHDPLGSFLDRGFRIREEECSGFLGICKDIRVVYSGDLPSRSKEGQPWVPGSVTKVKVTGIVRNENPRVWGPYIEGTSWKYIYRGKVK